MVLLMLTIYDWNRIFPLVQLCWGIRLVHCGTDRVPETILGITEVSRVVLGYLSISSPPAIYQLALLSLRSQLSSTELLSEYQTKIARQKSYFEEQIKQLATRMQMESSNPREFHQLSPLTETTEPEFGEVS